MYKKNIYKEENEIHIETSLTITPTIHPSVRQRIKHVLILCARFVLAAVLYDHI